MGVKKGRTPDKGTNPSHLRGEAKPLFQDEAEDSVDSDDSDDNDPKGASDISSAEEAVDDIYAVNFEKKSGVVESDATIETHWNNALGWNKESPTAPSSTKKLVKRWAGGEESAFRPFKEDPCLSSSFDKLRGKEKQHLEFRTFAEQVAGASAHASLSALVTVREGVDFAARTRRQIEAGEPVSPEAVCDLLSNFEDILKKNAISPLIDSVKLQASISYKAVATTRKNLVAVVNSSTKSVIEKKKPKDRFLFGNPEAEVNARFNQEYMESNSKPSSSSSYSSSGYKKGGFKTFNGGRFQHHKRATSSNHASSSSTSSSSSSSAPSSSKSSSSGFKKQSFRRAGPSKASK